MSILSFGAYYEPENVASPYISEGIRKGLVDAGYKVMHYVPTPSRGLSSETIKKYKKIKIEKKYGSKLEIHRYSMFREKNGTFQRMFRYLCCNIVQLFIGLSKRNIETIFVASTPPTNGAIAAIIKKIRHINFVYSLQDIFPDSLISTNITHKNSLLWKIGRVIENFTYKNADKIVVISQNFKNNLIAKGVPEDKIRIIPNWVEEDSVFEIERDDNIIIKKYNLPKDKFYITYCGNIGMTQNIDLLIETAEKLKAYTDIHFILIGNGNYKQQLENLIQGNGIRNVTILPFQPYEDISHVFSLGDISLVISKPGVGINSVPSKTWSIMSASRPIVASFDSGSDLEEIIEKTECGLFSCAEDEKAFQQNILKLYNNPTLRKKMGENGRDYIKKHLTATQGIKKYVDCIKETIEHAY